MECCALSKVVVISGWFAPTYMKY